MHSEPSPFEKLIRSKGLSYQIVRHPIDFTALEAAHDTMTVPREFVKNVLIEVDGRLMLAVVPSDRPVNLSKVAQIYGAQEVRIADEEDLADVFADCELGATPPYGHFYGLPVLMQPQLCREDRLTFNAGRLGESFRMEVVDFLNLVQPRMADICE
jgi:Ala-tRNA(Pro) deacylase